MMTVYVVIEDDRGCGISVCGVYTDKNKITLTSHEFIVETELYGIEDIKNHLNEVVDEIGELF